MPLFLFTFSGLLFIYLLRYIVNFHAFLGRSKSFKKKLKEKQSFFNRLFLIYSTKMNSSLGTWISLITYYIFIISWIIVIIASFLIIFSIEMNKNIFVFSLYSCGITIIINLLTLLIKKQKYNYSSIREKFNDNFEKDDII